jgi:hypothetical protein
MSWENSVGIETGYSLNFRGSITDSDRSFSSLRSLQKNFWGQRILGVFLPGCTAAGHEADHSSPYSAEVMNSGAIPPLPHTTSWRGALLITHRDNLSFYFKCIL